jgi:predicted nucleotidyltransferase
MFLDSLDLPNLKYKDIVMTGSLANKNYTDESDVDVHIIVDYNDINQDGELLLDYFKMKKNEWGDKYKITLYGYPVELFVQDDGQERDWTSIYSLINDDWLQSPELEPKKEIDKDYIKNEALSMITQIEQWEEMSKDGKNDETILEEIEGFMSRLRDMRSKGLERGGEMDNDNLIFKLLRTGGFLDKIAEIKEKIINKELSVNEKKKRHFN